MIVAIDETPVGVFVEIEGSEQGITAMAAALGRAPADYILDSYRGLFLEHRDAARPAGTDMLFDEPRVTRPDRSRSPALVLTAGLGTRLRPLTLVRAKAALPVAGEPLVRRILRWLVGHGVTRLVAQPAPPAGNDHARRRRRQRPRRPRALFVGAAACSDRPAARATRCRSARGGDRAS